MSLPRASLVLTFVVLLPTFLLVPKLLFGNVRCQTPVWRLGGTKQSFGKGRSQTGVWERGKMDSHHAATYAHHTISPGCLARYAELPEIGKPDGHRRFSI